MSNPSQWVLVKRFAEVTGYSENAIHHKVNSFKVLDVREGRERDLRGGTTA
ncbi:MAG: hypothetical protein JSR74_17230 [Proteobacteria bacterium]|nr:hypothetical protein [Pseudomonadota bacterium]